MSNNIFPRNHSITQWYIARLKYSYRNEQYVYDFVKENALKDVYNVQHNKVLVVYVCLILKHFKIVEQISQYP